MRTFLIIISFVFGWFLGTALNSCASQDYPSMEVDYQRWKTSA